MTNTQLRVAEPHELANWVGDSDDKAVVLEVSRDPSPDGYRAGHLPGARHVYWRDLTWDAPRRKFPSPESMSERLGSLGIGTDTQVVVYGDVVQFGVYVGWVLEMAGHPRVAVLDGGKDYWVAAGLPLTSELPRIHSVEHRPGPADWSSRISRTELMHSLADSKVGLVDVRSLEEYVGDRVSPPTSDTDHGAQVGGHIPGARHFFFKKLLEDSGRFKDEARIREELANADIDSTKPLVTYCRMGHRGALTRYVLKHVVGLSDVRVYDGSWTEWGSMADVPVAIGPEPGDYAL